MAFCKKCGKEIEEGKEVCEECKKTQSPNKANDLDDMASELFNTPDFTSEFEFGDILNNKFKCIFAYLGPTIIIPFILNRKSKFVRFHLNQGLMLIISSVILLGIARIIAILPLIGVVGGVLSIIVSLGIVLLMVIGIINTAKGKAKELPIIGKYRILK